MPIGRFERHDGTELLADDSAAAAGRRRGRRYLPPVNPGN
jgi:hypothetical protein